MTYITPNCCYCTHFNAEDRTREVCSAFPEGIPQDILSGKDKHLTSRSGDGGIVFNPVPGFEDMAKPVGEEE